MLFDRISFPSNYFDIIQSNDIMPYTSPTWNYLITQKTMIRKGPQAQVGFVLNTLHIQLSYCTKHKHMERPYYNYQHIKRRWSQIWHKSIRWLRRKNNRWQKMHYHQLMALRHIAWYLSCSNNCHDYYPSNAILLNPSLS